MLDVNGIIMECLLPILEAFDDCNLYGCETESLKLSRQFEPINDL